MIEGWHIPISGFTQSLDHVSGVETLWLKLRPLASSTVSLLPPQEWDADWKALAEFIWRVSAKDTPPDIRIYAYSWGVGHGAISLMKQLRRRGLRVSHAVFADGVYHSWWRPWRSMIFSPEIVVPDKVDHVIWFRQFQSRPRGADIVAADPAKTNIEKPRVIGASHEYMDDSPAFHATSLKIAHLPMQEGEST